MEETEQDETQAAQETRKPGSNLKPGEQSAWERWELPAMQSEHIVSRGAKVVESDEAVRPLTLDQIEEIRAAAQAEGHREGLEAGKAEGLKAGADEVRMQVAAFKAALGRLARPLATQDHEVEEVLAGLVTEVARNVIRTELQLQPEAVRDVVSAAVDALAAFPGELRVYLHPEDLELLQADESEELEGCALLARADLQRGGCEVQRDASFVDFSLDARFRAAVAGFVRDAYARPVNEVDEVNEVDAGVPEDAAPADADGPVSVPPPADGPAADGAPEDD